MMTARIVFILLGAGIIVVTGAANFDQGLN
jgi:hypothetical protein